MKKAYCIVNILKIYDKSQFQRYVEGHIPTVEKYNGQFLVKGHVGEVLEGHWENNLMVIHEFPSIQQYKKWYHSEDYRPWKELRQACADVNAILCEGQ